MSGDYHVTTFRHDGVLYTPIVDPAGRVLDQAHLAHLATVPCAAPARHILFVLADESPPRSDHSALRLAYPRCCEVMPLELGDTALPVGRVEAIEGRPAGATEGAVGRHLVALARLASTALADVVWSGIVAGHLRGVCAAVVDAESNHPEIVAVRLGASEENCLAGATIRAWVEDPSDRSPADLSLVARGGAAPRAATSALGARHRSGRD